MFDIGGWEFLLIVILGIIVIGPKELPGAIRTITGFIRRAKELSREFQSGLEEVARQVELDKLGDDIKGMVDPGETVKDLRNEIEHSIDPDKEIQHAMEFDREWTQEELEDFPSAEEVAERKRVQAEAKLLDEEGGPGALPAPGDANAPEQDPVSEPASDEARSGKPS